MKTRKERLAELVPELRITGDDPQMASVNQVARHFGPMTLGEIGKVMGCSRQMVEQILHPALRKLSYSKRARELANPQAMPSDWATKVIGKQLSFGSVGRTTEARDHDTPERECEADGILPQR